MTMNRSPRSTSYRLRVLIRAILFIACATAVVAAIVHARDVEQAGSTSPEQDIRQSDRVSADAPTPTPLQCFPCWFAHTRDDNFDS